MFLEKPHIITSHGTRACRKQDMLLRLFIFSFTILQSFMTYMLSLLHVFKWVRFEGKVKEGGGGVKEEGEEGTEGTKCLHIMHLNMI